MINNKINNMTVNKTFYIGLTAVLWLATFGLVALDKIEWGTAIGSLVGTAGIVYGLYKQYDTDKQIESKNLELRIKDGEIDHFRTMLSTANIENQIIQAKNKELIKQLEVQDAKEVKKTESNKKSRKQSRKSTK